MNLENIKVPQKINPCPIAEAVVEIRFDSSLPADAMIGIVFEKLQTRYPKLEKLPIMELPSTVRDNDPQLKFSPHYKLLSNDFVIFVGPKSLSVVCTNQYKGWTNYFEQIEWVFNEIRKANFVKIPIRLGVRYINFFENINIFEKIKIGLSLGGESLISSQNVIRSSFDIQEFHCTIQITNLALMPNATKGSSIDIDVVCDISYEQFTNFQTTIANGHEIAKKLFFNILNSDFLNTFNPEY